MFLRMTTCDSDLSKTGVVIAGVQGFSLAKPPTGFGRLWRYPSGAVDEVESGENLSIPISGRISKRCPAGAVGVKSLSTVGVPAPVSGSAPDFDRSGKLHPDIRRIIRKVKTKDR
jgi:hypothetical protein